MVYFIFGRNYGLAGSTVQEVACSVVWQEMCAFVTCPLVIPLFGQYHCKCKIHYCVWQLSLGTSCRHCVGYSNGKNEVTGRGSQQFQMK